MARGLGFGPFLPFAWYALMRWYAGYWNARPGGSSAAAGDTASGGRRLRDRQGPWFAMAALLAALLAVLVLFLGALPSFQEVAYRYWPATGRPWLLWLYPPYVLLCIGLALDALLRPEPSGRWLGDLARRRARPWFMAASLALLAVSLAVTGGIASLFVGWQRSAHASPDLALFDLVVATLIGTATVCLGQAIVAYEVFTGKTLPRRGFRRYWYNALILAAGYSLVASGSLEVQLPLIYSLLISTVLMVAFYALLVWRSFAHREDAMQGLRPFIGRGSFTERLLPGSQTTGSDADVRQAFHALCDAVLGAQVGYLVPLGALAPLAGPPLAYPDGLPNVANRLVGDVATGLRLPGVTCLPLDPSQAGGAAWAVPLWDSRGLVGVLLLGSKRDGGLYTEEEIELGRAAAERLLEDRASGEMARRLMALQRQRLAENQVLDGRTRRVLHDEILPHLHAAVLGLSRTLDPADPSSVEALDLLATVHRQLSDLLHEIPAAVAPQLARLGLIGALHEVTDHDLAGTFDGVAWQVEPGAERQARELPPLIGEALFCAAREAVRNAARHARPAAHGTPLRLRICLTGGGELLLTVEDNGIGLPAAANSGNQELVSEQVSGAAGAGEGLALYGTLMAVVGGTLELDSMPGAFTRVTLRLPIH